MITLYNVGCKFPVKEMEKSELRLLVIEDEKKLWPLPHRQAGTHRRQSDVDVAQISRVTVYKMKNEG